MKSVNKNENQVVQSPPPDWKVLFRRERAVFVIEIKVGETWVRCENKEHVTLTEAIDAVDSLALPPAVTSTRVVEVELVQTNTVVAVKKNEDVVSDEKKMKVTGRTKDCPVCRLPAPVLHDGDNDWTYCKRCSRALPV